MTADLRIEFGFIQAPAIFEKNITEVFLSPEKCQSFKTNQKNIYNNKLFGTDEYIYYVCDEDYEINKINSTTKISFTKKEMEYIFELNENELFMKYGNKKYFNIVFNTGYNFKSWIFGKPMFLKYKWVFDPDKKRIGIYIKEEIGSEDDNNTNKKNTSLVLLIILIVIIVVFLVVLAIFIYQLCIKIRRNRKIRANEILDEFDYSIN
jgi:hypothetical protein